MATNDSTVEMVPSSHSCAVIEHLFYEGSLFSVIGGGVNHLSGLASALARKNLPITVIVPSQIANISLHSSAVRKVLPARGKLPLRLLDYEFAKIVFLWRNRKRARTTIYLTRLATIGIATRMARVMGYRIVVEVNGPIPLEVRDRLGRFGAIAGAICELMVKMQLRSAHQVVCVSSSLKEYVTSMFPQSDILVLPNGATPITRREAASPSTPEYAAKIDIAGTPHFRFCYLGAVTEWYDLSLLHEAVRKQGDDAHLHVVGDGPLLVDQSKELSASRTNWGWLNSSEATEILKKCQVGVIPANPLSNSAALRSPLKLYHYLSAGLSVVVADIIEVEPELSPYVVTYKAGDLNDLSAALGQAAGTRHDTVPEHLWSWDSRAQEFCEWAGINLEVQNA